MECPKCGLEIDDKAVVCPNCKKVLKVVCPVCKSLNEGNTCKKCGYVIITKCYNCGKINPTEQKRCKKCNYPLEKSVIQNESNTDDFAILTVEFSNLSDIKTTLGSAKAFNKFKINLDNVIANYAKQAGLRRQVIDKLTVVRFNKDYTFNASAASAAKGVIDIINLLTRMNCKMAKRSNITVQCNFNLLKRSVNTNPNKCQSDFNIKLIADSSKEIEKKIKNSYQIIADKACFDALENDYILKPLNSVMVDGEMTMFYEMDIKDSIIIDKELLKDDEDEDVQIPNFVQNMLIEQDEFDGEAIEKAENPVDADAVYDMESINFSEINCDFIRTENIDVFYHLVNKLQSVPQGILAIKSAPMYVPYSLKIINEIEHLNVYSNIISITCYDEMKYSPYAFFRDLVSAIFEYTVSQKLFSSNDFSAFANIDPKNLIHDLITLTNRELDEAFTVRNEYFAIFMTLLKVIPNTLIFIENFDKIDTSSYDVLRYLFEAFEELQVSYLIQYDKTFSLHKDSHFLLSKPYYTEIALKPTPFEKIISENKNFYKEILTDFYFQRIAKYACGSILFLDIAIQYLIESGVYEQFDGYVEMVNPKTIIIPSNLNRLMRRRLNLLKDDPNAMRFLASVVLLGTRIDNQTIESLGYEKVDTIIEKLSDLGYIYYWNNCMYFPNYNVLRDNLLEVMNKVDLQKIANELFSKVLIEEMPSPVKSYLYMLLEDKGSAFLEWEKLAKINLELGDFNSYLNCCTEIIKLLDEKELQETIGEDVEMYKLRLYENISDNLYEYVPEKTQEIAELTLKNLEKTTNMDKLIQLCSKMIQGALVTSRYGHALQLTHKVLSLIPNASIDPDAPNFNVYFFLMSLVHIEILFNMGSMEDCLDIGYRVLDVINDSNFLKFKPDYMNEEQFKSMILRCVGYIAISNVIQLKGNVSEFLNLAYNQLSFIPKTYDIFVQLQELIAGRTATISENMIGDDMFSDVIYPIIDAFMKRGEDSTIFAESIYQAKLNARKKGLTSIEIFCDLVIGSTYIDLGAFPKASSILYKIIKTVKTQGMVLLEHIGWLLLAKMNYIQNKFDIAYGMLNNSTIQMEKDGKMSDFLLMLMKYEMFKIMMRKGQIPKAQICINQAQYITRKHNINFEFDTDADHYPVYTGEEEANTDDDNEDEVIEYPTNEDNNDESEAQ